MQARELTPEERASIERIRKGENWASDPELLREFAEVIAEIGDVRHGSVVVDMIRQQVTARLQDGRKVRATIVFTSV